MYYAQIQYFMYIRSWLLVVLYLNGRSISSMDLVEQSEDECPEAYWMFARVSYSMLHLRT